MLYSFLHYGWYSFCPSSEEVSGPVYGVQVSRVGHGTHSSSRGPPYLSSSGQSSPLVTRGEEIVTEYPYSLGTTNRRIKYTLENWKYITEYLKFSVVRRVYFTQTPIQTFRTTSQKYVKDLKGVPVSPSSYKPGFSFREKSQTHISFEGHTIGTREPGLKGNGTVVKESDRNVCLEVET